MASQVFFVRAVWDAQASVWCSESNIPGLVIETETLTAFEQCMRDFTPELLRDNLGISTPVSVKFSAARTYDMAPAV